MNQKIGNGTLKLPLAGRKFYTVWGGPSSESHPDSIFVKMAAEIRRPCQIDIPTPDFNVPSKTTLDLGVRKAVKAILKGQPLYVGCMAGRGRTGLFLAILAKTFGVENPVEYVRENYYSHAVETQGQYDFVTRYEAPADVRKLIATKRWWAWLYWSSSLTKQLKIIEK